MSAPRLIGSVGVLVCERDREGRQFALFAPPGTATGLLWGEVPARPVRAWDPFTDREVRVSAVGREARNDERFDER